MNETLSAVPEAPPRAALLQNRNLRWLLGGGALSMLGDQFTLLVLLTSVLYGETFTPMRGIAFPEPMSRYGGTILH